MRSTRRWNGTVPLTLSGIHSTRRWNGTVPHKIKLTTVVLRDKLEPALTLRMKGVWKNAKFIDGMNWILERTRKQKDRIHVGSILVIGDLPSAPGWGGSCAQARKIIWCSIWNRTYFLHCFKSNRASVSCCGPEHLKSRQGAKVSRDMQMGFL